MHKSGKNDLNLATILTFHPHGHPCAAIVAAGALCGQEVAGGRLEPVPPGGELPVADGGLGAHGQMMVEAPVGLPGDHLVVALDAWVVVGHKPVGGKGELSRRK